ncbi:DUF6314 family protein [Streptomyces ochraceiscleroticus]|uniref:DUF6314 family protein n=1 Tax=Streptomyces ochraceiscleroticus TaxID=47761 RepID=A0ABW1MRF6_9ACTN|nr:DUF6314 family protein [Streptomyces ochraceiscleroticus]
MSLSRTAVHSVPDALAYLAGGWSVERELRDGGHTGRFTGRAEFRVGDADDGWLHEEEGVVEWGGVTRDAVRTLRMLPLPDGTAEVSFADGRPFHLLDLRRGRWTAVHQCAADRYEGTFTVLSPDEWHLRWAVSGPAKNQLLTSVYRRARRGGGPTGRT